MSGDYELSHQDSQTAEDHGLIIKPKVRHAIVHPETEGNNISSDIEVDLDLSDAGSEEDEILQSGDDDDDEDELEKFISKRQMSYPPLPRYESPLVAFTSKEKLGILTPPLEESTANSIKSGRSSGNSMSRHVSFQQQQQQLLAATSQNQLINNMEEETSSRHQIFEQLGAPVDLDLSDSNLSPLPPINGKENSRREIMSDDESEDEGHQGVRRGRGGRREQVREPLITRTNAWESSNSLPMADLVLEGLIANFHKIQDLEALLLFTSEFGSSLKKVQLETIFHNFNEIGEILAELCSTTHFRLNMEAFNATNCFSDRLRQLNKPVLMNQVSKGRRGELTPLVRQFCCICGESKSVLRTEAGSAFSKLIRGTGPGIITQSLFKIMNGNTKASPKVKATALDAMTLLLLTFPRDDFQLEEVAKEVCSILLSPKRRLRLAALECLAVVAHALGPSSAMPLFRQLIEQEISNGIRSSTLPRRNNGGQSSAAKAVSARVSRRVLPSTSHTGLVHYAMIPLPSTNRALLKSSQFEEDQEAAQMDSLDDYGFLEPIIKTAAGKRFNAMGADILYVLSGSGAGNRVGSKSPTTFCGSSGSTSSSEGKFERSELGKSSRESSIRNQSRQIEEQHNEEKFVDLDENTYSKGFSNMNSFNGSNTNLARKPQEYSHSFIEQEPPPPVEFVHRYSSNDLRTSVSSRPVKYEYPRRGSEGYSNVNVRKSTPLPNSRNDFTVLTLQHHPHPSANPYTNHASKFLNGGRRMSSEDEDATGNETFVVDESEELQSKKSSAGSSTRDSGVSSLKSGRMLQNESPPSTGEGERADVEDVEIQDANGEVADDENEEEPESEPEPRQKPKTPSSSRGSGGIKSPEVTSNHMSARTPYHPEVQEQEEPLQQPRTQYRPVENSPPPSPRHETYEARDEFIPRTLPLQTRSSSRKKLSPNGDEGKRASTSPMLFRNVTSSRTSPKQEVSYLENGHGSSAEFRNGGRSKEPTPDKSPDLEIVDYDEEDEIEDETEDSTPTGNSRESTSSRILQSQPQCKGRTFLKKGAGMSTVIPTQAKRVYKGSFRESQGRSPPISTEVFPPDLKPLDSPKHGLVHGIQKLSSPEWETNIEGFRLIVRLMRHNPEFLLRPPMTELQNIILHGLRQLGNLRSQVCRTACLFFKELFSHLDIFSTKTVEQNMEKISEKLLDKSMDTNKFIRDDSGSALDSMVLAMPPNKCINALDSYGTKHRNAIVRKTTARLLGIIIRKLGHERVLLEYPDKTLQMLVRFLQEGNLETRTHAKSALSYLATHPSFDIQLRRSVPLDLLRHSDKAIYNLKNELKAKTQRGNPLHF